MANLLELLLATSEDKPLPSSEYFAVDDTLLRAWASHRSLERIDSLEDEVPPLSGGNGFGISATGCKKRVKGVFHGLLLWNHTHRAAIDGEVRLSKMAPSAVAFPSSMVYRFMENRNAFVMACEFS